MQRREETGLNTVLVYLIERGHLAIADKFLGKNLPDCFRRSMNLFLGSNFSNFAMFPPNITLGEMLSEIVQRPGATAITGTETRRESDEDKREFAGSLTYGIR
jgi:hypothetical protein